MILNEDPVSQSSTEALAGIAEEDFGIDTTSQKRLRDEHLRPVTFEKNPNTTYSNVSSPWCNHPL